MPLNGDTSRIGMLLEQTLGHVSHGRNLQDSLATTDRAVVDSRELPFETTSLFGRLPVLSNWTLRSSLAARAAVKDLERERPLDALFVHTHVPATLLGPIMKRLPTVVSIDATPCQIDSLGGSYQHEVRSDRVESAKRWLHARCFHGAVSMVSWSEWAADSLVADYGIDRERIAVIPPGVVRTQWLRSIPRTASTDAVKILFVGGDFKRKGGDLLLDAVEQLRSDQEILAQGIEIELHLVTSFDVPPRPGLTVYRGLTPNSPALIDLFHQCDIFALPTKGDCTPLVLAEAATAGLPTVATDVGAIGESVLDEVTGHLVEPTVASLMSGLRRLVIDGEHRLTLGQAAAEHAAKTMDSEKNALRVLDWTLQSIEGSSNQQLISGPAES